MLNEIDPLGDMVAIFCHRFDDATTGGRYAGTSLIGACYESDLIFALEHLRATVKAGNYLLESVDFDELSTADKAEFVMHVSRADTRATRAIVGFSAAKDGGLPIAL